MTDSTDEQIKLLARLRKIPTFAQYHDTLRKAGQDTTFNHLLLELMKKEHEQRQENNNNRRLKQACFPFTKTIDEIDLSRYDGRISELFVDELASCRFISEKKNLIMIGNPGRGKTHIAIGIGLKACASGMNVLFKNSASLSTELSEAKDNYTLSKLEKKIQKVDLLIQVEMGYVSFDRFQSELLFKVIADLSERGSIIVTTNLVFSDWTNLFENTAMVAALVDRLAFKSYVMDMNGKSYRLVYSKSNS